MRWCVRWDEGRRVCENRLALARTIMHAAAAALAPPAPWEEQTTAAALGSGPCPAPDRNLPHCKRAEFSTIGVKGSDNQGTKHGCVGQKQRPRKWPG